MFKKALIAGIALIALAAGAIAIDTRAREDISFALQRFYYALSPSALDAALRDTSLLAAAEEDGPALHHWLSLIGTKAYMERMREEAESAGAECHTPAHVIGRASYEVFGNRTFETCSAECHSGCYHGATEAYFAKNGTGDLNESLGTICSFSENAFFTHQCVHGIGHGLMAWESYELPKALTDCDLLADGRESCYTGVFMENIVGGLGGNTGHVTNYLSDDPHFPCSIVDMQYKGSCYFLQTSRMIQLFDGDFGKVAAACAEAPSDVRGQCFESMGRDVGGRFRERPGDAIAQCKKAEGAGRSQCLHGVVDDLLWDPTQADAALTFCKTLASEADKRMCYDKLALRATQVFPSASAANGFCERFETPYSRTCTS